MRKLERLAELMTENGGSVGFHSATTLPGRTVIIVTPSRSPQAAENSTNRRRQSLVSTRKQGQAPLKFDAEENARGVAELADRAGGTVNNVRYFQTIRYELLAQQFLKKILVFS